MLTELRYAARQFDKVYYVTRELLDDNSNLLTEENIDIVQIKKIHRIRTFFELPILFLRPEIIYEYISGCKSHRLPRKYWRYVGKELYCTQNLFHAVMEIVRSHVGKDKICVQSAWLNECAYVASRLKRNYPEITAVSLAHAYEINPERSNYVGYSCDHYKLRNLDSVYFIAEEMKNIYTRALPEWIQYNPSKLQIRYLGCKRLFTNSVQKIKQMEGFTICTCSGVNEQKRLDLLIAALSLWNGRRIHWIHIGDGILMEEVKQQAEEKLSSKSNVQFSFLGRLSNKEVQEYYSKHQVDLFVNVSISEGLPVSIMEAMSYGIPVIATDVGATREVVCYRDNMLLAKALTPKILCDKIEEVSNWSKEKEERMSQESLNIWKNKFDADIIAPDYYEKIRDKNEYRTKHTL